MNRPQGTRAVTDSAACRRQAERRAGLHEVVRAVAQAWVAAPGATDLQTAFLGRLRRLFPAAHVRLTELSGTPVPRLEQPVRTKDHLAYAVRVSDPTRRVVLEASFPDTRGFDEWTCQLLETAASLAAMVLDLERLARLQPTRGGGNRDGAAPLIGSSTAMDTLRERVERVATTDFTVLIEGESGTGKELVARQIHELSRRRHGPFVAINCAALVETLIEAELFGIEERTATGVRGRRGKFEHADGGTIFLDEVSELSLAAQAKLLRAIQDLAVERVGGVGPRRIDTRIVAATNRSLAASMECGLFRTDLFYRLGGVEVHVPPLRKRKEDVLELTQYFLSRHAERGRVTMTAPAVDALMTYDWPGNVRELERMIEGAIATCVSRQIGLDDLPISLRGPYSEILMPSLQASDTMRAWGSRYARLIFERCAKNKRHACKLLNISYHTLNAYLKYRPAERRAVAAAASRLAPAVETTQEAAGR